MDASSSVPKHVPMPLEQRSFVVSKNAEHAAVLLQKSAEIARAATPVTTDRLREDAEIASQRFSVVQTPDIPRPQLNNKRKGKMGASTSIGLEGSIRSDDGGGTSSTNEKYKGMTEAEVLEARIAEKTAEVKKRSEERQQLLGGKPVTIASSEIKGGGPMGIGVIGLDNSYGVDPKDLKNEDELDKNDPIYIAKKNKEMQEFRAPPSLSQMRKKAEELQALRERLENSKSDREHATELKQELSVAEEKVHGLLQQLESIAEDLDECRDEVDDVKTRLEFAEKEREAATAELPVAVQREEILSVKESEVREALEAAQRDFDRKKAVIMEAEKRLFALMQGKKIGIAAAMLEIGSENAAQQQQLQNQFFPGASLSRSDTLSTSVNNPALSTSPADLYASSGLSFLDVKRPSISVLQERRQSLLQRQRKSTTRTNNGQSDISISLSPASVIGNTNNGTSATDGTSEAPHSHLPPRRGGRNKSIAADSPDAPSPHIEIGKDVFSDEEDEVEFATRSSSIDNNEANTLSKNAKTGKKVGSRRKSSLKTGPNTTTGTGRSSPTRKASSKPVAAANNNTSTLSSDRQHASNKWHFSGGYLDSPEDFDRLVKNEEAIGAVERQKEELAAERARDVERAETKASVRAMRRYLGIGDPTMKKDAEGDKVEDNRSPAAATGNRIRRGTVTRTRSVVSVLSDPDGSTSAIEASLLPPTTTKILQGSALVADITNATIRANSSLQPLALSPTSLAISHSPSGIGGLHRTMTLNQSSETIGTTTTAAAARQSRYHHTQSPSMAAPAATFTVDGVSGISAGLAQHTLDKQSLKIEQLKSEVERRKQLAKGNEQQLFALRDRFDHLRVELLALRRYVTDNEWEAVRDLKAQIRFYQKERVALYTKLYGHIRDFVLPVPTPLYDLSEVADQTSNSAETPTMANRSPQKPAFSALDEIKKSMEKQIEAANAEGGHLHQQRIIDRLRMEISSWKLKIDGKNGRIASLRERLESVEKEAMYGNDLLLRGTDEVNRRLELLFYEASVAEKRAVEREAELHETYQVKLNDLESHIHSLEGDLRDTTDKLNGAQDDHFTISKALLASDQKLKEALALNERLSGLVPSDVLSALSQAQEIMELESNDSARLIEATLAKIAPLIQYPTLSGSLESFCMSSLLSEEVQRSLSNLAGSLKILASEHVRDSGAAQRLISSIGGSVLLLTQWWTDIGTGGSGGHKSPKASSNNQQHRSLAGMLNSYSERLAELVLPPVKATIEGETMTDLTGTRIERMQQELSTVSQRLSPNPNGRKRGNSFLSQSSTLHSDEDPLSARRSSFGADEEKVQTFAKSVSAGRPYVDVTFTDKSCQHLNRPLRDASDNTDIALGNTQSLELAAEAFGLGSRERQEKLEEVLRGKIANLGFAESDLKAKEAKITHREVIFAANKRTLRGLMVEAEKRMMQVEDHAEALNVKQRRFGDWYSRMSSRKDIGTWIPNDLIQLSSAYSQCSILTVPVTFDSLTASTATAATAPQALAQANHMESSGKKKKKGPKFSECQSQTELLDTTSMTTDNPIFDLQSQFTADSTVDAVDMRDYFATAVVASDTQTDAIEEKLTFIESVIEKIVEVEVSPVKPSTQDRTSQTLVELRTIGSGRTPEEAREGDLAYIRPTATHVQPEVSDFSTQTVAELTATSPPQPVFVMSPPTPLQPQIDLQTPPPQPSPPEVFENNVIAYQLFLLEVELAESEARVEILTQFWAGDPVGESGGLVGLLQWHFEDAEMIHNFSSETAQDERSELDKQMAVARNEIEKFAITETQRHEREKNNLLEHIEQTENGLANAKRTINELRDEVTHLQLELNDAKKLGGFEERELKLLAAHKQQSATLQAEIDQLKSELLSVEKSLSETASDKKANDEEIKRLQTTVTGLGNERDILRRELTSLGMHMALKEDADVAQTGGPLFRPLSGNKSGGRPPRPSSAVLAAANGGKTPLVDGETERFAAQIRLVQLHNGLMELLTAVKAAFSLPILGVDEDEAYLDVKRYFNKSNIEGLLISQQSGGFFGGSGGVASPSQASLGHSSPNGGYSFSPVSSSLPTAEGVFQHQQHGGGPSISSASPQIPWQYKQPFAVTPSEFKALTSTLNKTAEADCRHTNRFVAALRKLGLGGARAKLSKFGAVGGLATAARSEKSGRGSGPDVIRDDNHTERYSNSYSGLDLTATARSSSDRDITSIDSAAVQTEITTSRRSSSLQRRTPLAVAVTGSSVVTGASIANNAGRRGLLPPTSSEPRKTQQSQLLVSNAPLIVTGPSLTTSTASRRAASSSLVQYREVSHEVVRTSAGLVLKPSTSTGGSRVVGRLQVTANVSLQHPPMNASPSPYKAPHTIENMSSLILRGNERQATSGPSHITHRPQTQERSRLRDEGSAPVPLQILKSSDSIPFFHTGVVDDYSDIRNEDEGRMERSDSDANKGAVDPRRASRLTQAAASDAIETLTQATKYQPPNRPVSGRSGSGHRRLLAPISSADRQQRSTKRLLLMPDEDPSNSTRPTHPSALSNPNAARYGDTAAVTSANFGLADESTINRELAQRSQASVAMTMADPSLVSMIHPSPFTTNSPKISHTYLSVMARRSQQGSIPSASPSPIPITIVDRSNASSHAANNNSSGGEVRRASTPSGGWGFTMSGMTAAKRNELVAPISSRVIGTDLSIQPKSTTAARKDGNSQQSSAVITEGLPPRVGTSHGPLAARAHLFLEARQQKSPTRSGN